MAEHRRDVAQALTVTRVWAWAIVHAGKDVENRVWAPPHGARLVALHAGLKDDPHAREYVRRVSGLDVPEQIPGGVIVATMRILGFHPDCGGGCSPWAMPGHYHWQIDDVVPLEPHILRRGNLGLWPVRLDSGHPTR